jgi:uncharacterized RDD family membrane protein YckC
MEQQYPSLLKRMQSSFIDLIFLVLMMLVFSMILDNFGGTPDWVRMLLFVLIFVAYEPLLTAIGFTIGNYLMGIRVRRESDPSKRIHLGQSLLRYPIKCTLGWLSFVTIHSNPQKRAIHDLVAGSVMIKI